MTRHKRFALVVVIGCAFAWPSWVNGQDENAAVAQALSDYYRAFSAYDTQRALSYYNEPVVFITAQSVIDACQSSRRAVAVSWLTQCGKFPTFRGFRKMYMTPNRPSSVPSALYRTARPKKVDSGRFIFYIL